MFVVRTDVGKKRDINEDYYIAKEISSNCKLYIVCDGLGGYSSGEIASKMCCEIIYNTFYERYEKICDSSNLDNVIVKELKNIINLANNGIYELQKSNDKYKGMGTTLSLVVEIFNTIYFVSIGDSRIYNINENKDCIKRITEDDTYVNTLLKKNVITLQEAKVHPQKHVLTKAVGVFENIDFNVHKLNKNENNGYLLLCTDGVTNMISDNDILNIFKENDFEELAIKIIDLANLNGGNDNITAMIMKI